MENIAVQLSSAQIAALSDYYAGLPIKTVSSPQADPALVERGRTIATEGIRERAVPACAMCHESQGAGVVGAPHIAGQSATYLRRELAAMRHGGRGSTVRWNPMPAEAHDLDDKDIAALAAYYSSLQPGKAAAAGSAATAPAMVPASHIKLDLVAAKTIFDSRCVKCHANAGRGDRAGGYPDLTLQSAPYVAQSLYAFRTRARPNGKMFETASSLTFDEMTSLAHYIGGLTPQPALLRPDTQPAPRGAAIAMQGIPSRGVPACLSCHDAKGATALPLIPRLQGQSVLYLRYRLDNFAKRYDVNVSALDPMPAIASQLTKDERADLAAYFSAASPIEKPSARP